MLAVLSIKFLSIVLIVRNTIKPLMICFSMQMQNYVRKGNGQAELENLRHIALNLW